VDSIDRLLLNLPVVRKLYARKAATLKKAACLMLHRLGRLKPVTFVQWLATYRCNFQCSFCEASANLERADELTTHEVYTLIDDLEGMGAKRLLISGGEPLVREDMAEIIRYATRAGLSLGLVSNGYLTAKNWPGLQRGHYFMYFTSLDGPRSLHDSARATDSFSRVMDSLERFAAHKVPIRIVNTVVHPGNFHLLSEMLGIVRSSFATRWHLTPIQMVGRAAGQDQFQLNGQQLRQLVEFVAASSRVMPVALGESHAYLNCLVGTHLAKPFFCGAGLTRCAIMPEGSVMACQQVYNLQFAEGNIRRRPFSRIWRENFKDFRQWQIPQSCHGCGHLGACRGGCWAEMKLHQTCLKPFLYPNDQR
jgi:radical SAM protein with 4Fe4S-binding SPASM domain